THRSIVRQQATRSAVCQSGRPEMTGTDVVPPADDPTARLLAELQAAYSAAGAIAGAEPLGVRAIEEGPGRRAYLCAFEGPRFLCLTADLRPERSLARARDAAAAGLLWEHLEQAIDPQALGALVEAIGRLLAITTEPRAVTESLQRVAARALE